MLRVGVVGCGRAGSAIARAVSGLGPRAGHAGQLPPVPASSDGTVHLVAVADADVAAARRLADELALTPSPSEEVPALADLTVLAVPDDAIAATAAALVPRSRTHRDVPMVVHCSGARDASPLRPLERAGWSIGCWHPLQAFPTPGTRVEAGISWAVTAGPDLAAVLVELTEALEGIPVLLPAQARARYHAAATLTANYCVTLLAHSARLLGDVGMSPEAASRALLALLRTTLRGVAEEGLPGGLTGPLVRGDLGTVRSHLAELADRPDTLALYQEAGRATLSLLIARGLPADTIAEAAQLLGPQPGGGSPTPR